MDKIVCESLNDYRDLLLEADEKRGGPIRRTYRSIKSAPGRALRKARAKAIMEKYKHKLTTKINKVPIKYIPKIEEVVERANNRLNAINASDSSTEKKKLQKVDLLDDIRKLLESLLTSIKEEMLSYLKLYAESIDSRLQRAGTVTGVEFYPEEKTDLGIIWKEIEGKINLLIQEKLIALLDNIAIAEFYKVKSTLEEFIKNADYYHYGGFGREESGDESVLTQGSEDHQIYKYILEQGKVYGIEFNKPMHIYHSDALPERSAPSNAKNLEFVIDAKKKKVGYRYVIQDRKKNWIPAPVNPEILPFIKPKESFTEDKNTILKRVRNVIYAVSR